MSALERIVRFYPAYDKRDPDPKKNYGIHGVELLMLVKGEKGAVQFKLSTNWQLPHVTKETVERTIAKAAVHGATAMPQVKSITGGSFEDVERMMESVSRLAGLGPRRTMLDSIDLKCFFLPTPVDLGYHSYTPHYEGQEPVSSECEWLGGKPCYYDGSTLNAERIFDVLVAEGDEGVWRELEVYYMDLFDEEATCENRES